jgi:hypothetical protein
LSGARPRRAAHGRQQRNAFLCLVASSAADSLVLTPPAIDREIGEHIIRAYSVSVEVVGSAGASANEREACDLCGRYPS